MGNLAREKFDGKTANVLRGAVSMANNGGFIQMATNLAPGSSELSSKPVDASKFEGVELDVQSFSADEGSESFNVQYVAMCLLITGRYTVATFSLCLFCTFKSQDYGMSKTVHIVQSIL